MTISEYISRIEQQYKAQDAIYHSVALRCGLSDTAMWVLYMVAEEGDCATQQELCRQCSFPKQTVNTAIANLQRQGYLALEPVPGARRQKRVFLTQAGRQLAAVTTERLKAAEERAYHTLSEEELAAYLDMTIRLTAALKKETEERL